MSDPTERTPVKRPEDKPDKAGTTRLAVAATLGGIAAIFAVINLDKVEVNWLIGSWQTPFSLRQRSTSTSTGSTYIRSLVIGSSLQLARAACAASLSVESSAVLVKIRHATYPSAMETPGFNGSSG